MSFLKSFLKITGPGAGPDPGPGLNFQNIPLVCSFEIRLHGPDPDPGPGLNFQETSLPHSLSLPLPCLAAVDSRLIR